MVDIKVPKTPKSAYNPSRRPSGLIQAQIQHLEAAAGIHDRSTQRRARARSEGEAAEYIARLTARIQERTGAPADPEIAVPQPPPPIAGSATPTSTTRHRTMPASRPAKRARRQRAASKRSASGTKKRAKRSSKRASRAKASTSGQASKKARRRRGRA
jgi:hypothetical protein